MPRPPKSKTKPKPTPADEARVAVAMPVAHLPLGSSDNYDAFKGKISASTRRFRQPVTLTPKDSESYVPGLELFFDAAGNAADLFAWVPGDLRFKPAKTGADASPARLILQMSSGARKKFSSAAKMLECPAQFTEYENVSADEVKAAMVQLITRVWEQRKTASHPLLTTAVVLNKGKLADLLAKHEKDATALAAAIASLVDGFMAPASDAVSIPVLAGDRIGRAGASGDERTGRQRKLLWKTLDSAEQALSPLFYLHAYLRAGVPHETKQDGHPLRLLYPELVAEVRPAPRLPITTAAGTQVLFPNGSWGKLHKRTLATYEWRYAEDGRLETKPADPKPLKEPKKGNLARDLSAFWALFGKTVNEMCLELQVPCEVAMAICGHETSFGTNPAKYRLEPLNDKERAAMDAKFQGRSRELQLKYDYAAGIPATKVVISHRPAQPKMETVVATQLTLTLMSKKTVEERNKPALVKTKRRRILISNTYRPKILSNEPNVGKKTVNDPKQLTLEIPDEPWRTKLTPPSKDKTYARLTARGRLADGTDRPAAEIRFERPGTLRALRAQLSHALTHALTVTVVVGGNASKLSVVVPKSSTNVAAELKEVVAVSETDAICIEVTPGEDGNAVPAKATLSVEVHLAPATEGPKDPKDGVLVVLTDGTQTGEQDNNAIPTPWNDAAVVRDTRPENCRLTWGETVEIVDALAGSNMSPGFMQTLIGTARDMYDLVKRNTPDALKRLEIEPPPEKPSGFFKTVTTKDEGTGNVVNTPGWLVDPRNSFFCGIAKIKQASTKVLPGLDLPDVCSGYNDGGQPVAGPFGVKTNSAGYVWDALHKFNATVEHYGALPAGQLTPSTRFHR
jgi:hypothetical protein